MKRLTSEFRLRFSLHPSLPRGMHIIIVIFIIATTIVFTTLEIRPNHLWSKLASINSTNLRRSFASYIHDFPANLCLTKNPLPRIRHELGFDDIIRGVNSAVGTLGEAWKLEILEPTDRGKTRPRYFAESLASSSAIMNASTGAITRNYTRRRVPTRWRQRGGKGRPDFRRVHAKSSGRYL